MSGPKAGSYDVETAQQREARMRRDAKADYVRAQIEWKTALARLAAVESVDGASVTVTRPAPLTSRADATAYAHGARELSAAAQSAMVQAAAARDRAAAEHYADHLQRMIGTIVDSSTEHPSDSPSRWQTSHPAATAPPSDRGIDRRRVAERIGARLHELGRVDHDTTRVDTLLADIASAGTQLRIDLLIGELDYLVTTARAEADREASRDHAVAGLSAMRERLSDLAGPDTVSLRLRLDRLIAERAMEIPADLESAVIAAIAEADADADRRHVAQVLGAALTELGYATGPEFSTALSGAQSAAYARSGSSNYGIKLRLEPGTNRFTAQAVKSDATVTSTDEDVAAEERFCAAMERVAEMATHDGVALRVDVATEPGAYAVQRISAAHLSQPAAPASRSDRRRREREVQ